jgi:hypothetical protein
MLLAAVENLVHVKGKKVSTVEVLQENVKHRIMLNDKCFRK